MDFSLYLYLEPFLRYLPTNMSGKIPMKMHIEMHVRNNVCLFIQKTLFPKRVPIHSLRHLVRQFDNLSDPLLFISLSRAIPEISVYYATGLHVSSCSKSTQISSKWSDFNFEKNLMTRKLFPK